MQGQGHRDLPLTTRVGSLEVTIRGPLPEVSAFLAHLQDFEVPEPSGTCAVAPWELSCS